MEKLTAATFAPLASVIVLLILAVSPAALGDLRVRVSNCNSTDGNYTSGSTYKTNLDSLFEKTTTANLDYGFYNFSAGEASLISLCLGNVDVTGCHTCQNYVMGSMRNLCPNQKTAIAWSDDCMVRYSKHSIFGVLAEEPGFVMLSGLKASDDTLEEYSDAVKALLEGLPGNASAGDSRRKFASARAEFNSSVTIYAAAQCTPDLNRKECSDCVNDASSVIQSCDGCKGKRGARALLPSCMVRYEEYEFYLSSDAPVPSPSLTPVPSPSTTPSPSLEPVSTPRPSPEPASPASPSHDVNTSVAAPSPNSSGNAPAVQRIGRRSSIVAIAIVGACLSSLL